jgi:hypothetical protein
LTYRSVSIEIANIPFSIEVAAGCPSIELDQAHNNFLTTRKPEISFRSITEPFLSMDKTRLVFDAGALWTLNEDASNHIFSLRTSTSPRKMYKQAVINNDYSEGTIYMSKDSRETYPLAYPLEELIFINLLGKRNGFILHSCGMGDGQNGYIFSGVSGAGKSTISKLIEASGKLRIMSDDRAIISRNSESFMICGTPWHGTVKTCENLKSPLKKVFFIRHAKEHYANRWDPVKAASHLIARSFPPYWDKEGMARTVDLCRDIANSVPCYELGFKQDKSIAAFIETVS